MKCGMGGYGMMEAMIFFKLFAFAWMVLVPYMVLARLDKIVKLLEKK